MDEPEFDDLEAPDPEPRNRPGRHSSKVGREQLEERIETTAKLLARRLYKGDVKRALEKRYGVDARTAERYMRAARALLVEWSGRSTLEHRVDALAFYESVIRSDAPLRDRLVAQGRLDALLGLEAPKRLEHTGKDGAPLFEFIEVVAGDSSPAAGETDAPGGREDPA